MTDGVKIANTTACDMEGLTAEVKFTIWMESLWRLIQNQLL